jgi:hypothetical protein
MRTVLSAVMSEDGLWRAEITWPNRNKNYCGKFATEAEAAKWIARHQWLTQQDMEPPARRPRDLIQVAEEQGPDDGVLSSR